MDNTRKQMQRGKQMRKVLTIIAVTVVLILVAMMGRADSFMAEDKPGGYTHGRITDHYERITEIVQVYDSVHLNIRCTTRTVPTLVPGRRAYTPTAGERLGGAVIGGVLGKLLTNDDKGAIGGAIIGGLTLGHPKEPDTVEYIEVDECRDMPIHKRETKNVYSHSTINFIMGKITYNVRFIKHGL